MRRWTMGALVVAAACARAPGGATSTSTLTSTSTPTSTSTSTPTSTSTSTSTSTPTPTSTSTPHLDGQDFIAEARILFRVAACGSSGDTPPRFDQAVIARHCDELGHAYDEYRKSWVDVAKPFMANLRPKDVSSVVVYPFGGGDLVSALATFPDATEITTMSLEPAGDVRPIDNLGADRLAHELAAHRGHLERLLEKAHSRTDNLEKESKSELPGEIVFALAALAVHGSEPVSLRYFRLGHDGSVEYVSAVDLEAAVHKPRELRALFDNVELRFRASGDAGAPVQVLRHLGCNLDDDHLKADGSLILHLSAKGKVAAMTKAASHLLWNAHFSLIRSWLLEHVDWMASDSTGIPPRFAQPAGFTQETYGKFDGPAPFGLLDDRDSGDLKRLFAAQPTRDLAFRYGYPDKDGHAHLIVTSRK